MRKYYVAILGCFWDGIDWMPDDKNLVFSEIIEAENLLGAFKVLEAAARSNLKFIELSPVATWNICTGDGKEILYGGFDRHDGWSPSISFESLDTNIHPEKQPTLAEEFAVLFR